MEFTNSKRTSWRNNDKNVSVELDGVISSMYYELNDLVAYLVGPDKHNINELIVYDIDGNKMCRVFPPDGFQFEYLVNHPSAKVCVICGVVDLASSGEKWSDFYFGLDIVSGKLNKIGIAR